MNYYKTTRKILVNGEPVPYYWGDHIRRGRKFDDFCFSETRYFLKSWNEISSFYGEHFSESDAKLKICKKGYRLSIRGRKTLKSWKDKICIEVIETSEEAVPSMQTLLDWPDSNEVLQYLIERGLQVLSHGKR